jgi:hypothetical protein
MIIKPPVKFTRRTRVISYPEGYEINKRTIKIDKSATVPARKLAK